VGGFYVYILASRRGVLYVGVTNDLLRRIREHRQGLTPGFTSLYRVHRLVYFENYEDAIHAIARETD
jgi:putative endonuclease